MELREGKIIATTSIANVDCKTRRPLRYAKPSRTAGQPVFVCSSTSGGTGRIPSAAMSIPT